MIARQIVMATVAFAVIVLLVAACRSTGGFSSRDTAIGPAWAAWRSGDYPLAEREAQPLLAEPQ